jgi:hypothetical protein
MKKILIFCFLILLVSPLNNTVYSKSNSKNTILLKKQAASGDVEAQLIQFGVEALQTISPT